MESIPDEIKLMEQIAKHLKMWFQEHPDDKDYPSGIVNLRFRNGILLKLWLEAHFDEVLTYLRVNDHKDIARSLEQERDSFLSELQAVEQAIERGDNPPLELIELRSKITYLIGTLEHTAKAFTEKAEQETKPGKELSKNDEKSSNLISCVEISGIIRKRSDAIARTLRAAEYPVIKKAGKNYCNPEQAAVLFPKWKEHLKIQQKDE